MRALREILVSHMKSYYKYYLLFIYKLILTNGLLAQQKIDIVEKSFLNSPESAKPWVFWYWLHGAVSKEGITADLEAMKYVVYMIRPIDDLPKPCTPLFDLRPTRYSFCSLYPRSSSGAQLSSSQEDFYLLPTMFHIPCHQIGYRSCTNFSLFEILMGNRFSLNYFQERQPIRIYMVSLFHRRSFASRIEILLSVHFHISR